MNIGKAVKFYRNSKKLTLKELSSEIKVTASFLSDLENNKRLPSIDTLQKLAYAFGIPMYILLKEYSDIESAASDKADFSDIDLENYQDNFLIQARALFLSDDLSEDDKEVIFKDITELYWKAKGFSK